MLLHLGLPTPAVNPSSCLSGDSSSNSFILPIPIPSVYRKLLLLSYCRMSLDSLGKESTQMGLCVLPSSSSTFSLSHGLSVTACVPTMFAANPFSLFYWPWDNFTCSTNITAIYIFLPATGCRNQIFSLNYSHYIITLLQCLPAMQLDTPLPEKNFILLLSLLFSV